MNNLLLKIKRQIIFFLIALFNLSLEAQVPTGHNLDFSTGGYLNWIAKTGRYNYWGNVDYPIYEWDSTWSDPTQANDFNGAYHGGRLFIIYNG